MSKRIETQLAAIRRHLRATIQDQGFTQEQVDRALGLGQGSVNRFLGGSSALKVERLYQILEVVGVEAETFFSGLYTIGQQRRHDDE